ncbi:polymeric immunoglobulin receptor-like [Sinocyclocheilus grahami]|uniref:polymeric immunoglobulin receptor-like n=1 Tax=Sinocyclocheilus grahami TaxID=75366 RepID=UPI0007ACDEC0|nr:PREDICTED: polymeric immunoglobulin receptor-like [Sinocyclocheilus grahami]
MIQIRDDKLIFHLLLLVSVAVCETNEILTFTAHERGTVEIQCSYKSTDEEHEKYLGRGKCPRLKKDKVVESGSAAQDKRFSLTDDKTAHIFTVTITDLRTEDQDQYWCGVKRGLGIFDDFTEIHLEIKHVSRVSGVTGKHLYIPCNYSSELKNDVKFICKGSDPSLCETSAVKVSSESHSNGRFSLSDNASAGVFTVTITDLREEDSGIYWCGAAQRRQKHKKQKKWISVIDLNISAVSDTSERPLSKPNTTRASFHSSKPAPADTASSRPVTSSSSSSSSSVLMFFSSSPNAVSPKPQPGLAPIFMVMVIVIGILTGFGFSSFIYLRRRQKKEGTQPKDVVRGPTKNLPSGDMGETREADCDYEDISSTLDHPDYSLVLPAFAEHEASVYALAQLPSSPSDDLNYSSIKFTAAHHSDGTSDGQETCDYTTVRP